MAITAEAREEIIAVFIGMFNAAPGATYLTQMVTAYEAGVSTLQIAEILSGKIQFAALWGSKTNSEIADQLVANLLSEIPSGAQTWSKNWIVTNLNSGMSVPEVIHAAILAIRATDNPNYALAKAALANEVEVASYFSLLPPQGLGLNGTTLAELQAVIAGVTSDDATVVAAKANIDDIANPPDESETFTLTTGQDDFTGGDAADLFRATGTTLQLGDNLEGGEGDDTLDISISGSGGGLFDGFTTDSIETIRVKSLSSSDTTIDLSGTKGVTTLESYEVDGADMTFRDIQNMNGTTIRIIDTDEDHTFVYDLNAYDPAALDVINLELREMRSSTGTEGYGADLEFINRNNTQSNANTVNLLSGDRTDAGPTPATANYIDELRVGSQFQTFNIEGNADLEIEDVLDVNIRTINAGALVGDLTLDANTDASNPEIGGPFGQTRTAFTGTNDVFMYTGAQGDDNFDIVRTGNSNYNLGTGDDNLQIFGDGNQTIVGGEGSDSVGIVANFSSSVGNGDGRHSIDLGAGDDYLYIEGNVDNYNLTTSPWLVPDITTIDAGAGNDYAQIEGNGHYDVVLGTGDDFFGVGGHGYSSYVGTWSVDAGEGNDTVNIWAEGGYVEADLGAGDDELITSADNSAFYGSGSGGTGNYDGHSIAAGAGSDLVYLAGDGNQSVTGGEGNDLVLVGSLAGDSFDEIRDTYASYNPTYNGKYGVDFSTPHDIQVDGVHNIDLGDGDDALLINGARNGDGNVDNTGNDDATVVLGGAGNDDVRVTLDHILDVDLGTGDDTLDLRAQDLTVDDTLEGGAGYDALTLRNAGGSPITGRVLASETIHTTGFEEYDLRDINILLQLTNGIIDTAEEKDFTVRTENSDNTVLPFLTLNAGGTVEPFFNGMTKAQFETVVANWRNGLYSEASIFAGTSTPSGIAAYYETFGSDAAELGEARSDLIDYLENYFYDSIPDFIDVQVTEVEDVDSEAGGVTASQYFFIKELEGAQTVDMTKITTPQYNFTLLGGNVRDIIIADDDSINSRHTLRYDSVATGANSITDTLRVLDGAEITAADLRNVTGLEIIELVAVSNVAQEWHIELNERVINQTTSEADLVITVDDNVPSGSKLYITLDPSIVNATSNVRIEKNAAISVYINGNLVTEPEFGDDFNPGPYSIIVTNRLIFTEESGDNLVGTDEVNDTFIANSLAHIQTGDSADGGGYGDFDTLEANFAVNNAATTLQDIFENANITNIERLEFNTENNVRFDGIGLGYMSDLEQLATGIGNDDLSSMRKGLTYFLNDGDDTIELSILGGGTTVIYGGAGFDAGYGSAASEAVQIDFVEYYDASGGTGDSVDILSTGSDDTSGLITIWNAETITATSGDDNIYADSNSGTIWLDAEGGNDTVVVGGNTPSNTTVYGGLGNDTLTVYATSYAEVYGDDNSGNSGGEGNDGNDSIYASANYVYVDGQGGNDSITASAYYDMTVDGGSGNDYIYAYSSSEDATVDGASGNDTMDVYTYYGDSSVTGGTGDDSIYIYSVDTTVDGGTGNDTLYVNAENASVTGGTGSDYISLYTTVAATVDGGDGADSIYVSGSDTTITGGLGDDAIDLSGNYANQDQIMFGDVTYSALQVQTSTMGVDAITGFNFESYDPDTLAPAAQDALNFTAFLGNDIALSNIVGAITWELGDTVDANNGGAGALVVLSATSSPGLNSSHFSVGTAGTIQLANNGKAVVVVGIDGTAVGTGIQNFEVYYVQDIDTGAGQTWAVDMVATIEAATAIGVPSILDNMLDGLTITGTAGSNIITGGAGEQTIIGGNEDDVMTGGTEADVFAFGIGETTSEGDTLDIFGSGGDPDEDGGGQTEHDIITDFNIAEGDKLDFSNLDFNTNSGGLQAGDLPGSINTMNTNGISIYSGDNAFVNGWGYGSGDTVIIIETDNDGSPLDDVEGVIFLVGVSASALQASPSSFILS